MKFINFTKEDLINAGIIILIVLFLSFCAFVIQVDAQFQYPTISYADCDIAFLEWNVDDYTYSLISQVRIVYEGESGVANYYAIPYADMGTLHWWYTDTYPWVTDGHEWIVTGYVILTTGNIYDTINFRRVDCRYKSYLPLVIKK